MFFQYWPIAYGAGPTLKKHRMKSSCLLGYYLLYTYKRTQSVNYSLYLLAYLSDYVSHAVYSVRRFACVIITLSGLGEIPDLS